VPGIAGGLPELGSSQMKSANALASTHPGNNMAHFRQEEVCLAEIRRFELVAVRAYRTTTRLPSR
jgi:hypothetical protein